MSNHVAAIVQRRVVGSATKKTVLMYMAERASDDGTGIWTSKSHMSLDTELSKRSVQTAIKEFEEAGIIKQVGTRACKHGFTYEYSIDMEALKTLPSTREKTGAGDSPVQDFHPKGCTTFTPTGAGDSPKPSLEPSLEPSINAREQSSLFPSIEQPESKVSTSEAFEDLWSKYPKEGRKDKPAAKKKFAAIVKSGVGAARIVSAAETYARWLKSGAPGEFRPQAKHLTTWLNKGSYEDEIDAPPPQAAVARWYEDQIER